LRAPVLTEAFYLLDFSLEAQEALWEMIAREAFVIEPLSGLHDRMRELMPRTSGSTAPPTGSDSG
jgi:hypothetical protein